MISTAAARISIAAAIFSRADALTSRSIALTLPEMPSRISVMPFPVLLTNFLSTSNNLVGLLESPTMFFRHTQIEVSIPTAEPATKPLKISSRVTVLAKLPSEVVILSKISEMNLPNAWSGPWIRLRPSPIRSTTASMASPTALKNAESFSPADAAPSNDSDTSSTP